MRADFRKSGIETYRARFNFFSFRKLIGFLRDFDPDLVHVQHLPGLPFGRRVALKLPKTTNKDAKLLREARTAAKLRHPNIVSIYEVGVDDEQVFIASEYIDGDDLQSELASGRPDTGRAASIVATIARAVHHAHENGIVHRDIKPANIMFLDDGSVKVADFGIATVTAMAETTAAAAIRGLVMSTPFVRFGQA